ncbi:hypothetical protein [Rhodanobacter sp. DHB23]|uniref:hypothetical protein n=1 Tax=Rhodanobacter sp. DHB23 TaxID=2775923 RepID=UPI00177FACC5|nr:hypothetical protein [Rhodanobacter sp. DHB23]MBD8873110.1 hypothetical protein [Rhodanobacter sp. DHB23]
MAALATRQASGDVDITGTVASVEGDGMQFQGQASLPSPTQGKAVRRYGLIAGWLLLGLLWMQALLRARSQSTLIVDEAVHVWQVSRFMQGQLHSVTQDLTNIPGYHLLVAGLMWLSGSHSLAGMRTIDVCFGLLGGLFFYLARLAQYQAHQGRAVAQFLFFPLLYPYVFLVYTDVLSVALVLAALAATLRHRHVLAALALVAAMMVRQNNVVWAAFLAAYALWPILAKAHWRPMRVMQDLGQAIWPYLVVMALFLAYWAWNGTIVFESVQARTHPDASFHLGNPFFLLCMAGVFLPLQLLGGLRRFLALARADSRWLLLPLATIACYTLCFTVSSRLNFIGIPYFLHNDLLVLVTQEKWASCLFGLVATIAACGLAGTRFASPQGFLLYPVACFYLAASTLIEVRYALVPMALWLALRQQESDGAERATLAIWVAVAQYFALGVLDLRFMP